MARRRRSRGIALIVVIWFLVLLSIMATGTVRENRAETQIARATLDRIKAKALAEGGIHRAILALNAKDQSLRWLADGRTYDWRHGEGIVAISVVGEAGKIDLNFAPTPLLRGLFESVGLGADEATALADAVADYRDENDLKRLNGAEDGDYARAGYEQGAKDAPFALIDELRWVFGMTPDLFTRVQSLVTVNARQPSINAATAPPAVLRAVPDIDGDALDSFLEERSAAGVEDDIVALTPPFLETSQDYLFIDFTDTVFTIRAEARVGEKARFIREAVVLIDAGNRRGYEILDWRQPPAVLPRGPAE